MRQDLPIRIKISIFWTKLIHWEFWPFGIIYLPVYFYWVWLSIKSRSLFFFSSSNPGIEYAGMLGESKYRIHLNLPQEYVPVTCLINKDLRFKQVRKIMDENKLVFPVILKPDIGERGWMVAKIHNEEELKKYINTTPVDYLIQEYVDLPIELGIFYYRYPGNEKGKVSSIVRKKMLEVTGTGKDSIEELIIRDPRARLQLSALKKTIPGLLSMVPGNGEVIELVPIGNHARGTTFLNVNHLIDERITRVFDRLCNRIEGFHYGRFDIRCTSYEEFTDGNFTIMELNGAGAEPGHIYHPGSGLFDAYKSIISHLRILFEISFENHKRGVPYMTFKEGIAFIREIRRYNKLKSIPLNENT